MGGGEAGCAASCSVAASSSAASFSAARLAASSTSTSAIASRNSSLRRSERSTKRMPTRLRPSVHWVMPQKRKGRPRTLNVTSTRSLAPPGSRSRVRRRQPLRLRSTTRQGRVAPCATNSKRASASTSIRLSMDSLSFPVFWPGRSLFCLFCRFHRPHHISSVRVTHHRLFPRGVEGEAEQLHGPSGGRTDTNRWSSPALRCTG